MKRINSKSSTYIFPNLYICNNHDQVRIKRFSLSKNSNTWLSICDFNNNTFILSHYYPAQPPPPLPPIPPSFRFLSASFDPIAIDPNLNISPETFLKKLPTLLAFS